MVERINPQVIPENTLLDLIDNSRSNDLSPRQKEVLTLTAKGLREKQIASELQISEHTVTSHKRFLYKKLGAHNSLQATVKGIERGFLKPEELI